jgi:caffeoyl-CoA O-methyltransferase
MLYARAEVVTSTPDRFIRQLVSHLSHKATTELQSDGAAVITVEDGQCKLTTGAEMLVLEATADSTQGLAHIQDVVGRHLERFGARAALRVDWKHDGPAIHA